MYLADINYNGLALFVSVAMLAVGVLGWWVAKLLDDKKNSTIHDIKVQDHDKKLDDHEQRIRHLEDHN
jgi:hypothetical protein